jgi:hypothetical protein
MNTQRKRGWNKFRRHKYPRCTYNLSAIMAHAKARMVGVEEKSQHLTVPSIYLQKGK